MSSLETQLAKVFKAGLAADPKIAKSLAASLTQLGDNGGKVTKSEANYHTSHDEKSCGNCDNFDGKDACKVVSGHVTADGVSDYWTGQTNEEPPQGQSSNDTEES
jgi:hypothetical protein